MIRSMLRAALVAAPLLLCPLAPAAAQYVVYDPSNYAQNLLQAARALQQVTNQITSLQNEAQMLITRPATSRACHTPPSARCSSRPSARSSCSGRPKIAYDVGAIDRAFQGQYGSVSLSSSDAALVTQARTRLETTVAGLQDALRVAFRRRPIARRGTRP
jgi:type IV secretion system protein TrbJ